MKKNKQNKKILLIGIILIVIIVVSIFLIFKLKNSKNIFLGTWKSEGGTIYEFKKNKEGVMKTSLSKYKFTYKIIKNTISIDFEDKKAIDTDYEFSCKKDKCEMKSDRGKFIFNKQ